MPNAGESVAQNDHSSGGLFSGVGNAHSSRSLLMGG